MPALPPVPNVLRVSFHQLEDTDTNMLTRLFFRYQGSAPTSAQLATLAASMRATWGIDLASLFGTTVQLFETVIEDLTSPSAASGIDANAVDGTRAGNRMPLNSAALINYKIARRYRGGKPRSYWPMGTETDILSASEWTAAFSTAVATQYAAFILHLTELTWAGGNIVNQVAVSYFEGFTVFTTPSGRAKNISTLRSSGPVVDVVQGFALNPKFGTQRRRVNA